MGQVQLRCLSGGADTERLRVDQLWPELMAAYRRRAGMTLLAFAQAINALPGRRAGVTVDMVLAWERGTHPPALDLVARAVHVAGLDVEEILRAALERALTG